MKSRDRAWFASLPGLLLALACGGSDDSTAHEDAAAGATGQSGGASAAAGAAGTGAPTAGSAGEPLTGSGGVNSTGGSAGSGGGSGGAAGATTSGGANAAGGSSDGGGGSGGAGAPVTGGGGGMDSGGSNNLGTSGQAGATSSAGGAGTGGGGVGADSIATWTDAPGACPAGLPQRDIGSVADLQDATRGEGAFTNDPPGTCYLIADGTYDTTDNALMYVVTGGTIDTPRYFVGQSRDGVVITAHCSVNADHVVIQNLTFDLTGYQRDGSFNTLDIGDCADTRVERVTFTGDCRTGSTGGHIELNYAVDTVIDSCIVENFGHCSNGHEDHGIYVASATNATIRNSIIRGNASRGIQLYTQQGDYGTIDGVVIEGNRIYGNGHGDYEDGIAISGEDTGTIANVTIRNNLIYENYYSGVRFVGAALSGIAIEHNTFHDNGLASTNANRSEVNLDDDGSGADTVITQNIFVPAHQLLNACYGAAAAGFSVEDNVVFGTASTGDCISGTIAADPEFVDAPNGDYHPGNTAVAGYGAYP